MPKHCLSHEEDFGPPRDYARIAQIGEEGLGAVEVFHLHIAGTELAHRVGG